jgi:hypothetical protein
MIKEKLKRIISLIARGMILENMRYSSGGDAYNYNSIMIN